MTIKSINTKLLKNDSLWRNSNTKKNKKALPGGRIPGQG